MNIITVNSTNIEKEHVCCAISNVKGDPCLASRKAWMQSQFEEGLTFKKMDVTGKVFIEYLPAENAWCPIKAPGYLFIKCFWVSGQYKGKGYANILLEECIKDAKERGKQGLVILSSAVKKPFLSDPKYLKYKGFMVCDTAKPYFELLYLPFDITAPEPEFHNCCKEGQLIEEGFTLYYSDQCPYSEKYSMLIADAAKEQGTEVRLIKFRNKYQAQASASPCTTYSLFYQGKFVTNEILSVPKFLKLMKGLK